MDGKENDFRAVCELNDEEFLNYMGLRAEKEAGSLSPQKRYYQPSPNKSSYHGSPNKNYTPAGQK